MIRINLLPYREQLRAERRRQFGVLAALAFLLGILIAFFVHMVNALEVDGQEGRNRFLESEISELDKQIVEIRALREQFQALLQRKKIIESLQGSRNEAVQILNQLTVAMPEGVYLTSLKQNNERITLQGYAQSDPKVAPLMRRLESQPIFTNPRLIEVSSDTLNGRRLSRFTLDVDLVRGSPDDEKAGGGK